MRLWNAIFAKPRFFFICTCLFRSCSVWGRFGEILIHRFVIHRPDTFPNNIYEYPLVRLKRGKRLHLVNWFLLLFFVLRIRVVKMTEQKSYEYVYLLSFNRTLFIDRSDRYFDFIRATPVTSVGAHRSASASVQFPHRLTRAWWPRPRPRARACVYVFVSLACTRSLINLPVSMRWHENVYLCLSRIQLPVGHAWFNDLCAHIRVCNTRVRSSGNGLRSERYEFGV